MRNTVRDVVIHLIIGAIALVVGLPNFFIKINFAVLTDAKAKAGLSGAQLMNKVIEKGPHFSVIAFVLTFAAAVFIILGLCGIGVAIAEREN
ncbi:MAG: hypothetical protein K5851_00005 [Lachnospiraceae bacterium]|nr:hypothetical protein [Lachnospiraceae bacterium]